MCRRGSADGNSKRCSRIHRGRGPACIISVPGWVADARRHIWDLEITGSSGDQVCSNAADSCVTFGGGGQRVCIRSDTTWCIAWVRNSRLFNNTVSTTSLFFETTSTNILRRPRRSQRDTSGCSKRYPRQGKSSILPIRCLVVPLSLFDLLPNPFLDLFIILCSLKWALHQLLCEEPK